jgi:hypothetical protein
MATNICLDCGHFLVCNKAKESIQQCSKFIKVHREIEKKECENTKENNGINGLTCEEFVRNANILTHNGLEIERKDSNENNDKSTNEWQDK